jgi:hypothetical protein
MQFWKRLKVAAVQQRRLKRCAGWRSCRERRDAGIARRNALLTKDEKEYWEKVKRDGWEDKLHELIKLNTNHPGMHVKTLYNLAVLQVCRYNQRIAMLRAKFKKEGKDPRLVAPTFHAGCRRFTATPSVTFLHDFVTACRRGSTFMQTKSNRATAALALSYAGANLT